MNKTNENEQYKVLLHYEINPLFCDWKESLRMTMAIDGSDLN